MTRLSKLLQLKLISIITGHIFLLLSGSSFEFVPQPLTHGRSPAPFHGWIASTFSEGFAHQCTFSWVMYLIPLHLQSYAYTALGNMRSINFFFLNVSATYKTHDHWTHIASKTCWTLTDKGLGFGSVVWMVPSSVVQGSGFIYSCIYKTWTWSLVNQWSKVCLVEKLSQSMICAPPWFSVELHLQSHIVLLTF